MAKKNRIFVNPFYLLLVVTGTVFCLTACAFGVMTVRGLYPDRVVEGGRGLMELLDQHGAAILIAELIVLAVATVAAIGTDGYWEQKATSSVKSATRDESSPVHVEP